jgi:UDP-glucose 4-epimerase
MLVTGGAGFLGSHLVARAAAAGFEVVVVDDCSRGVVTSGPFDLIRADVTVAREVRALPRADVVVHAAALCGEQSCLARPDRVIEDFSGTSNVCDYAVRHDVERLVFLSSGEIYGSEAPDAREDDDVTLWNTDQTRTYYALSKLLGEARVRTLPMPTVVVRPFNVYGPGQNGEGAVRNFMAWASRSEPLQIYDDGTDVRCMCHVDDFVDGCFTAITSEARSPVYNIGNPSEPLTVREIASAVIAVTGSHSGFVYRPMGQTRKRFVTPNIDRARRELGYAPSISLAEGLRSMLEVVRAA